MSVVDVACDAYGDDKLAFRSRTKRSMKTKEYFLRVQWEAVAVDSYLSKKIDHCYWTRHCLQSIETILVYCYSSGGCCDDGCGPVAEAPN